MNLNETINQIQGTEITEGKVDPRVLKRSQKYFDEAKRQANDAMDTLGDIGHDLAADPKLQARIVELFRQMLKVTQTFNKIKF
jgi:hypothetical protein